MKCLNIFCELCAEKEEVLYLLKRLLFWFYVEDAEL